MKLSRRLRQIEKMVTPEYTHVWDCCCDHGYLGASLLSRKVAKTIHFVDIVPELITNVESKLQRYHPQSTAWETHCLDVKKLPLDKYAGKHIIIIAGVGGDLMSRMVNVIRDRHPDLHFDFLLCPVHRQFVLRKTLIELKFQLKNECLIEDKHRFYEVMLVTTPSTGETRTFMSPIGDKIWQVETTEDAVIAKKYLNDTLNYYRRMQQGDTSDSIDDIIAAYNSVTI